MLSVMASPSERPIDDPLLQPDRAPRDARGAPVRAPLGNSGKTLLAFIVLAIVGAGVWWLRRPPDLTMQLGGREWVITTVDGEPAVNDAGTVSTFVLDGNGEIRSAIDCNTATGSWSYEPGSRRLDIDWHGQTSAPCPDDWPQTYLATDGHVSAGGGSMRVESEAVVIEAISPVDLDVAGADELAGSWMTGGSSVDIGIRGLFRVDGCEGEWSALDDGGQGDEEPSGAVVVGFDPADVQRAGCDLDPMWEDETPIIPVVHDGVLFLRRDRSFFPLDRSIVRLDPVDDPAASS